MFNRPMLKDRAKTAFKRNYWPCVLVALILSFVMGGSGGFSGSSGYRRSSSSHSNSYNYNSNSGDETANQIIENLTGNHGDFDPSILAPIIGFLIVIFIIAMIVSIAFSLFVAYPLVVGCKKYFSINAFENPNFNTVGFSFKKGHYMNIVKVEFMKNLFIFLWTLLLIIPGIIKTYEYYMVDYILSEDPNITYNDALEQSRRMMDGHKWDAFVLELSFLGWHLLSIFTCGLLSIFYVNPYYYATLSEFFLYLRYETYPDAAPYYIPQAVGAYGAPMNNPGAAYNPNAAQFNPNQGNAYDPYGNAGNQYNPNQGNVYDPYGDPSNPGTGVDQNNGYYNPSPNQDDPNNNNDKPFGI